MPDSSALTFLFVVNKGSGKEDTDWQTLIRTRFQSLPHKAEIFELPDTCCPQDIEQQIEEIKPDRVVAVGGDGTVKLCAQCCMQAHVPLGILPAGSANGMAKEFKIPDDPQRALDIVVQGRLQQIHLTKVNDELCIHLADIGFNAYVIRKFDSYNSRGMWGYVKAAWAVLRSHSKMQVQLQIDGEMKAESAAMIVIANATMYGSGACINPVGKLSDDLFEVIVLKKVSFTEIFKMMVTHKPYDPEKTEVFQTNQVHLTTKKAAHFQVDGEYLGRVHELKAAIIPNAVEVIVPR